MSKFKSNHYIQADVQVKPKSNVPKNSIIDPHKMCANFEDCTTSIC